MSRPVCGNCMCLEDETGCGCTEMKQEPVAWIDPDVIPLTHIIKAIVRREKDEQHTIPLYTEPQYKELSDLEMISIYEKDWSGIKCGLGRAVEQAILKKAMKK